MALFVISQDRQTQVLAAVAMATTIIIDYNSWFPSSLSPAKCSACNNPSDSITEIVTLEQLDYHNQKQNEVLYVNMENLDLLPPTAPSLVFARETYTPYTRWIASDNQIRPTKLAAPSVSDILSLLIVAGTRWKCELYVYSSMYC